MTDSELQQKIDAIAAGPSLIAEAVAGCDASALDYQPAPGKWSIREIVAHLADIDVLYGYRLRQMIADKTPVLAAIDQDDWARNLHYRDADVAEALECYRASRRANVRLLRGLRVADLQRGAFHPELKRIVTIEELLGMMLKHDPNHRGQIERLRQQAAAREKGQ
jgi:uncharacterized damage-inducible protein DinB